MFQPTNRLNSLSEDQKELIKATAYAKLLRDNYFEFFKVFAVVLEPNTAWDFSNWHVKYLCDLMQEIAERWKEKMPPINHIINLPPSSSKSLICSVIYSTWLLARQPSSHILLVTYSDDLTKTFGEKIRTIIKSAEYNWLFRIQVKKDIDNLTNIGTHRYNGIVSVTNLTVTGKHFNFIICDDFMSTQFISQRKYRQTRYDLFFNKLQSRIKDSLTPFIVVEQRLNGDLTGEILKKGLPFKRTVIPLELNDELFPRVLSKYYGRTFWDRRWPQDRVQYQKSAMGSRDFNTQYNQTIAQTDNLIKDEYFDHYTTEALNRNISDAEKVNPRWKGVKVITEWKTIQWVSFCDPSFGITDPSAFLTCALFDGNLLIKDVSVMHLDFPSLCNFTQEYMDKMNSVKLYVEPTASGRPLVEQLKKETLLPISTGTAPFKSKVDRVTSILPFLETKRVLLLQDSQWIDSFMDECVAFPLGDHDDQVDVLVMAVQHFFKHSRDKEGSVNLHKMEKNNQNNITSRGFGRIKNYKKGVV
jgi:predicted phage terminase large subunit-like protein